MIAAVIPAHNEADLIAETVAALRRLSERTTIHQIVVVDDGSRDDTAAQAEAAGADIVARQPHAGKGAALRRGLALTSASVIVLIDADLGATAAGVASLLQPILDHEADMTIAVFPRDLGGGHGFGLAVWLARVGVYALTGHRLTAPLSGQRSARRCVLEAAGPFAGGWEAEIDLTVNALRQGFRVCEVQTQMRHRARGRSPAGFLHRGRQFMAVARVLVRAWTGGISRRAGALPAGR